MINLQLVQSSKQAQGQKDSFAEMLAAAAPFGRSEDACEHYRNHEDEIPEEWKRDIFVFFPWPDTYSVRWNGKKWVWEEDWSGCDIMHPNCFVAVPKNVP